MSAYISADGKYRYWLKRQILPVGNAEQKLGSIVFVMLNPSTADAETDDQTIRRCISFSRSWGYSQLAVVNLYALRSKDPKLLLSDPDPVGPENDGYIRAWTGQLTTVVAWGAAAPADRVAEFWEIVKDRQSPRSFLWCLGTTRSGAPRHPCRLRVDTQLERWRPPK